MLVLANVVDAGNINSRSFHKSDIIVTCYQVTCFEYFDQLLPREDPDAAKCLQEALLRDGLTIRLGESVECSYWKSRDDDHAMGQQAGGDQLVGNLPPCVAFSITRCSDAKSCPSELHRGALLDP